MAIDDGGPAFPTDHSNDTEYTDIRGGMSLRDYFAGQALASLVASALSLDHNSWAATAQHAYYIADAMLKAREKASEW